MILLVGFCSSIAAEPETTPPSWASNAKEDVWNLHRTGKDGTLVILFTSDQKGFRKLSGLSMKWYDIGGAKWEQACARQLLQQPVFSWSDKVSVVGAHSHHLPQW